MSKLACAVLPVSVTHLLPWHTAAIYARMQTQCSNVQFSVHCRSPCLWDCGLMRWHTGNRYACLWSFLKLFKAGIYNGGQQRKCCVSAYNVHPCSLAAASQLAAPRIHVNTINTMFIETQQTWNVPLKVLMPLIFCNKTFPLLLADNYLSLHVFVV